MGSRSRNKKRVIVFCGSFIFAAMLLTAVWGRFSETRKRARASAGGTLLKAVAKIAASEAQVGDKFDAGVLDRLHGRRADFDKDAPKVFFQEPRVADAGGAPGKGNGREQVAQKVQGRKQVQDPDGLQAAARNGDKPTPEPQLLSQGKPATSDVRGNLGPASVVTSSVNSDWLRHRWQAASDMNGTPIPGPHWITIDLQQQRRVRSVTIDFETAHATEFRIEQRRSLDAPWTRATGQKSGPSSESHQHHIVDVAFDAFDARYVRLYIIKPATMWGVSVWEMRVYGN